MSLVNFQFNLSIKKGVLFKQVPLFVNLWKEILKSDGQ
jgi:hypothetical protein